MTEEIKDVSHLLGKLVTGLENLEKQSQKMEDKLDCVHKQTIITNESVKSAHKRLDTHATIQEDVVKKVDNHEGLVKAGYVIFGGVSFCLGLLGTFIGKIGGLGGQ
jgi:hypothetical protein